MSGPERYEGGRGPGVSWAGLAFVALAVLVSLAVLGVLVLAEQVRARIGRRGEPDVGEWLEWAAGNREER